MADDGQRMVYEARVYGEQLRLLEQEIERISMTSMELSGSLRAVEALKEEQVFVPVGGGAMINARVASSEVLVPVGGGYLISMKKHEAIEEIKKRIKNTETATEKLRLEFQKINGKLVELSGRIDAARAGQKRM